ncbi:MAG: FecR domain-containing protein [Balneolales bacterium]
MIDRQTWKLIQRYVTGNANAEEQRQLNIWLDQHPDNSKMVQEIKKIWKMTPEEDFDINVEGAWEQFQEQRMKKVGMHAVDHTARKPYDNMLYIFRVAAVILVTLFTGYLMQQFTADNSSDETVAEFPVMENMETGYGEKARVSFSDGTEVTLNSASSVRFPQKFNGSKREIYLDGEAYFKVAHDSNRPFIVHTQDARVQVLGTEFNIRGWAQDPSVEVVVRDGKVSVNSSELEKSEDVILTKGYSTNVRRGENPLPPQKVDIRNNILWLSGGFHFDNKPLNQVITDIERRFNVQVSVASTELLEVPYTGTFQYAELDEILSVIASSMDIGYRRDGSKVEFD